MIKKQLLIKMVENQISILLKSKKLWILLILTFFVGLFFCLQHRFDGPNALKADALGYHRMAIRLLNSGVYTGTYRAPGYPAFVTIVYSLFGEHPVAVFVFQALLFTSSVLLVALSFTLITGQSKLGFAAAIAMALFPPFYLFMICELLTETLALFLITLLIWLLLLTLQKTTWWKGITLAIVFSCVALTKAVILPFASALILLILFAKSPRYGISCVFAFIITLCIAMTPWTIRNYEVTGEFLPVSSGSGVAIWMGNYPENYGRFQDVGRASRFPYLPLKLENAVKGMSEVEQDKYLKNIAIGYIKEDPYRAGIIFLYKFSDSWLGNLGADVGLWSKGRSPLLAIGSFAIPAQSLLLVPLFFLAVMGVFYTEADSLRKTLPILLLFFFWTSAYIVTISQGMRYMLPVYPYVLGFASIAIIHIRSMILNHSFATKP